MGAPRQQESRAQRVQYSLSTSYKYATRREIRFMTPGKTTESEMAEVTFTKPEMDQATTEIQWAYGISRERPLQGGVFMFYDRDAFNTQAESFLQAKELAETSRQQRIPVRPQPNQLHITRNADDTYTLSGRSLPELACLFESVSGCKDEETRQRTRSISAKWYALSDIYKSDTIKNYLEEEES